MRKLISLIHDSKSSIIVGKIYDYLKKCIDPVIIFMIIMYHFDFGIFQTIAVCLYIIYKLKTSNRNFNSKVAFS